MPGGPCAAEGCEKLCTSKIFEFCFPHFQRLRELNAQGVNTFVLRWKSRSGSPERAREVEACVAALAADEGREYETSEPLE